MQTVASQLEQAFRSAIREAYGLEADPLVGVSQNDKFGDYQSNAPMGLAKQVSETTGVKTNPRAVAEQIKAKVTPFLADIAGDITIAGPGFINVRLKPEWLSTQLKAVASDPRLGSPLARSPKKVVVDYSGPNVAKQMHVGHLRSTIIGDAISRVIEFQGHEVIRQNHIGDWGTQFGMLITYLDVFSGAFQIGAADKEALLAFFNSFQPDARLRILVNPIDPADPSQGQEVQLELEDLEALYRAAKKLFDASEDFQKWSRATVVALQAHDARAIGTWRGIVDESRRHNQPIYDRLGVKLGVENERGESFYNASLPDVVRTLKEKHLATESQGATAVFIDGAEKPPVIVEKTGGGFLYATTDLAALWFRVRKLHANRIIYTHDSRQAQHFDQVFRIARAAGFVLEDVQLDYAPFGTMLGEDGKPFKTRSGDTVKLKDLLDEAEVRGYGLAKSKEAERVEKAAERGETVEPLGEDQLKVIGRAVGIGAVKYSDLSKDRTSDYAFSWDRALAMDGNTAPYLQYAYARIRSIFRRAGVDAASVAGAALNLDSPHELALAKHIFRLGEVIDLVARELKPHHLCSYLYDLATRFSAFYENCPVLKSEEPTRSSRLLLCDVTARALALGLDQIGIEHPEQM